uniref:cyclin-I-like isoform X2 n=1 Tax=Myxine glutinosa TaxID=7769 RepID=UPI00358E9115
MAVLLGLEIKMEEILRDCKVSGLLQAALDKEAKAGPLRPLKESNNQAQPKYLKCIAVGCLFLAAKVEEEAEMVPRARRLARVSACGLSPAEILRMERTILAKLGWDLHVPTALRFLHIFLQAVSLACPTMSSKCTTTLGLLTRHLETCLSWHTLAASRPATLALALVSLKLEGLGQQGWLGLTAPLQARAKIQIQELVQCREEIHRFLFPFDSSANPVFLYSACSRRTVPISLPRIPDSRSLPGTQVNAPFPSSPDAGESSSGSDDSPCPTPSTARQGPLFTTGSKQAWPPSRPTCESPQGRYIEKIGCLEDDPSGCGSPCPPLQPVGSLE